MVARAMMRLLVRSAVALAVALLAVGPLFAQPTTPGQVAPGAVRERARDALEYFELRGKILKEPEREPAKEEQTPPAPGVTPQDAAITLQVKAIQLDASEILSSEELAAITAPLIGREVSLAQLKNAIAAINGLYREKGFITAKAFLPPQKVEGGIVKVRLVEGHIGEVTVTGNHRTRQAYIDRRLDLTPGDLLYLRRLERDLHRFNATNDAVLRSSLAPGSEFGLTDVLIEVAEPPPVQTTFFSDNTGTESVGTERFGFMLNLRNEFNSGERILAGGNLARDTEGAFASVDVPITRSGTRFSFSFDYSNVEVEKGPLSDLDIVGESRNIDLAIKQPVITEARKTLFVNPGFRASKTRTRFDGVPIFENTLRAFVLGADLQEADERGQWYANAELLKAVKMFSGDTSFWKFAGNVTRVERYRSGAVGVFRGRMQLADQHNLPSSEQFQLGGQSTVRGFREGLLSGDKGYLVSAELMFPLPGLQRFGPIDFHGRATGSVFVDHGGAFPFKGDGQGSTHEDYLTGAGVGLSFPLGKRTSARVSYAFQLSDPYEDQRRGRVHFSLQTTF